MKDSLESVTPTHPHQNPLDRSVATKTSPLPYYMPHAVNGRRTTNLPSYVPKLQKQWHKAKIELPLQCYKDRGLVLQPRPRLDMEMSVPVWSNRANRVLQCELSGVSALRGRTGYCNGSAGLRFTNTDTARRTTSLMASVGNQGVLDQPLFLNHHAATVQLGVETTASKSSTTLSTYFNFPKPLSEPSRCTLFLAAHRRFRLPRIQQPVKFGTHLSTFSIKNPIALGFVASDAPAASSGIRRRRWELKVGFAKSTNDNNSRSSTLLPSIQFFLSPPQKLASKVFDIGVFWKASDGWGLGGTWRYRRNEKPTIDRQFSVGALFTVSRRMKSLSWVFSWTESDCTLRIPVLISQTALTLVETYQQQLLQLIYISLLSRMIQDAMGTFLSPTERENRVEEPESMLVRHQKARQHALQQQSFMARQARIRMKAEKERNGLIIERAVYYIRSEREPWNDQNSLDVTIPIQFWVDDSKLHLFDVCKRGSMLGFYDLVEFASPHAAASKNSRMTRDQDTPPRANRSYWTDRIVSFFSGSSDRLAVQDNVHAEESLTAELAVRYSFAGTVYEITIGDSGEIILPDPGASRVVAGNGV